MATEQILSGYMSSAVYGGLSPATIRNFSLYGIAGSVTIFATPSIVVATPGIFYDLKVKLSTAPGAGKTFKIFVRNLPLTDQRLIVNISDSDTEGEDRSGRIFVNAGSFVVCAGTQTTGTAASDVTWSVKFQPLVADQTILGTGDLAELVIDTTNFWSLAGPFDSPYSPTEKQAEILIPGAGTIKDFYVNSTDPPGTGKTRTFTVRKNLADTSVVVAYTDLEEDLKSDLSNSFSVAAGDRICVKAVGTGTADPTFVTMGLVFVPDNSGEWIWAMNMLGNTLNPSPPSGATHIRPVATKEDDSETEADHQNIITPFDATATIEAAYARLTGFPGPGNSYSFTLRKFDAIGLGSTLVCDSAGIEHWTSSNAIADDDLLSIISSPFSAPTARGVSISLLGKCTNVVALKRRVFVDGIQQFEGDFQS